MKVDSRQQQRGFALIATMAIMSLIVMVAVGSISLSKGVAKGTVALGYQREAQSNARMAMMIALGELQKELGPDQRVSASMGIFAGDPKSSSFKADQVDNGYANPHILGVWDSWTTWLSGKKSVNEIKATYDRGRTSNFRRLLVSHPDGATLSPQQWRDYASNGSEQLSTVALVSSGSLGSQTSHLDQSKVMAPLVDTESGRFAWYVSGNNQKANVALGREDRRDDLSNHAAALSNVTGNGLNKQLDRSLGNYPINKEDLDKVISVRNAQLLSQNSKFLKENFHSFTSHSQSVLANVRNGGLKKDINLLMELDDPAQQLPKAASISPESGNRYKFARYAYRGTQDDSFERNPRPIRQLDGYINDKVANTNDQLLSKHLPSWQKLANYYNEYKVSINPQLAQWTFDRYGTSKLGVAKGPRIAAIYIQLGIYTVGAGPNSEAWITYNPVLHLWNPYNTPLKVHPTWVATNFPCIFIRAYQKNTNKELFKWQRLMHYKGGLNNSTTWHGKENGGLSVWANFQGMVLQPGEVKVLTTKLRDSHKNESVRAELSPGFNVGNDIDRGIRVRINPLNDAKDGESGYKLDGKDVRDYNLEVAFSNEHNGTSHNQLEFFLSARPDKADHERVGSSGSDNQMHDSAIYLRSPFGDTLTKYYKLSTGAGVNFATNNQFLTIGAVLKGNDSSMGGLDIIPEKYANKNFVMSNPSNPIFVAGEHALPKSGQHQYQLPQNIDNGYGDFHYNFEPQPTTGSKISQYSLFINNGIGSNNSMELDSRDNTRAKIFKPTSNTSVALMEIPTSPIYSLASFQSFPPDAGVYSAVPQTALSTGVHDKKVNSNRQEPSLNSTPTMRSTSNVTYAIANSFANPLIAANKIYRDTYDFALEQSGFTHRSKHVNLHGAARYTYDHSFMLNDALFDDWFCSSITPQNSSAHFSQNRSIKQLVSDLAQGEQLLPNQHLRFSDDVKTADAFSSDLSSGTKPQTSAHKLAAQGLMVNGGFNVNSTSHLAWKALFNSLRGSSFQYRDPNNGNIKTEKVDDDKIVVSRFSLPLSPNEGRNASSADAWQGVRFLTEEQIDKLAHECVRQVKLRGPFLNMADFVNRRLDTTDPELSRVGALQAAIDWDEFNNNSPSDSKDSINGRFKGNDEMIEAFADREEFPEAHQGSKWSAIPGYVIQGDLLKRIGNQLTVRDDTFTIRAYGEATDERGQVQARAYCEAIVQRGINYVDDQDEAFLPFHELRSENNEVYGRKMKIIGFRWLSRHEI